jgi:hypothetical protein
MKLADQFVVSVHVFVFTVFCRRDCLSYPDRSYAQALAVHARERVVRMSRSSRLASGSDMTAKGKSPAIRRQRTGV